MDIELAQTLAENKLLKSLLYCTKRSCNNCGKVTCENFQRQRIDCCGNWVSYKDYIKELEQKLETERSSRIALVNKIADLEAQIEKMKNCKNCANYMISGKCPCFFRTGWCKNWKMAKGVNYEKEN